jgi:hypothetical protein
MQTCQTREVLTEACADTADLDQVVGKLLDLTLSRHRNRLARYARDVHAFEERSGMDSPTCSRLTLQPKGRPPGP